MAQNNRVGVSDAQARGFVNRRAQQSMNQDIDYADKTFNCQPEPIC
jgi:hypothetical protein